jgi:hypothetical protein
LAVRLVIVALIGSTIVTLSAEQDRGGIRGDAAAVAMAETLLESVGGRDAWRNRTLIVEERGFPRSGEITRLKISRDFQRGARVLENNTSTVETIEWLSPGGGWISRNGKVTPLTSEALALELRGLKQEPYAIYHRLARRDPGLRVQFRPDSSTLFAYDNDESVLCWFLLDAKGGLIGWGNFYNGNINQHYYGPLINLGDAAMPKWGAASNGSFRFEYVSADLVDTPLAEPSRSRD